jgi:hypothetical protein
MGENEDGTALSFLRPCAAHPHSVVVYVCSGQERFAAVGGLILLSDIDMDLLVEVRQSAAVKQVN